MFYVFMLGGVVIMPLIGKLSLMTSRLMVTPGGKKNVANVSLGLIGECESSPV